MFAFFTLHEAWWVYASIPFLAGGIGYVTKLLMIEMMFRPLEFKGLFKPYLGWQGQVPRNAAKMAATTVDTLQESLLDPRELVDMIDIDHLLAALEVPLNAAVAEIAEEIGARHFPTLWNSMPDFAKDAVIERTRGRAPEATRRILDDVRDNLDQVFDLKHTVVNTLVRDKRKLNRLFRGMGGETMGFMTRAGLLSGFVIGVIQAIALMATGEEMLLPLFGLVTGGLTDWLALYLIFRPVKPGRVLGVPWQGRFHRLRPRITKEYAAMMVQDILTPQSVLEELLTGPRSDKLFRLVEEEVRHAVDRNYPTIVRPLVVIAVGGREYQAMKETAARRALEKLPTHMPHIATYVEDHVGLQQLIEERMGRMTDDQYEGLLRPIFKEQEWVVVVLGALLGFAFGELQLHLFLS